MEIITSNTEAVKTTADAIIDAIPTIERDRLEADYAEYAAWCDANADLIDEYADDAAMLDAVCDGFLPF